MSTPDPRGDDAYGSRWVGGETPAALIEAPTLRAFRGRSLVALIAVCVGTGALLAWGVPTAWASFTAEGVTAEGVPCSSEVSRAAIRCTALDGPGGRVTLNAPDRPTVVNVWLQGCADCMPAFERWRDAVAPALDERVVNVAYGRADAAWAERYRVGEQLVFDAGTTLVQPLGISTFTTLVVAPDGVIVFRGRPTDEGYAVRMAGALEAVRARVLAEAANPR